MANIKLHPMERKVSINFSVKQKYKDAFIECCKELDCSQSSIGEALIIEFIKSRNEPNL